MTTTVPEQQQEETPRGIRVEFGNTTAHRCIVSANGNETTAHDHEPLGLDDPSVTYLSIPPGYSFEPGLSAAEFALHLARNPNVTHLPGHEAALVVANPVGGMWGHHGSDVPKWVASDNADFAQFLGEFYGIDWYDLEDPDFHGYKEDSHHTLFGPPGVGAQGMAPRALKVNGGNDIQAALLGGGQVDFVGQASASSATTLTRAGSTWTVNQWAGCRVYCTTSATNIVWGLVISNTSTALTVDRWYDATNPGGAAGTTALSTGTFVIVGAGGPAAWFMGLTATATAPSGTDTALTGEITTASGGLVRKICPYAHTTGATTYTLTPVFTGNGSDSYPVTIAQIGVFNSMVVSDTTLTMLFRTLLNATATLSASGDQLTVTETVTM